jgi:hypothetical protein
VPAEGVEPGGVAGRRAVVDELKVGPEQAPPREAAEAAGPVAPKGSLVAVDDVAVPIKSGQVAPPKADGTGDEPDPFMTSARNAMMEKDRERVGLSGLDGPKRRSWGRALGEAKRGKIVERAFELAQDIAEKPRALTDTETAAMVLHANGMLQRHDELMAEIARLEDPGAIAEKSTEAARLEQNFDVVSTALKKAGTETGRALAARKLTIGEDMRLLPVLQRAKAAKGKELSESERAGLTKVSKDLEAMTARAEAAEKKLAERRAERTIQQAAQRQTPGRRRTPEQDKADVDRLLAKTRDLLAKGCR